tara:strand:+ start:553 stop:2859 length:2307 start_codon:yes stop_codon:yes gene_type:complete
MPPTFSPDGEWMWDGESWIPAPPKKQDQPSKKDAWSAVSNKEPQIQSPQSMNMQDSVVAGDVNITQNIGVDENSIMSMMITELEKFDYNKSGFHVPQGGFSSSAIIAGIDEIKQNVSHLNRLSTEHLLEFCTALESIGYSDLLLTAAKIILERGRIEGNRTFEAKAHLFIADGYTMMLQNTQAIIHSQESINIAKDIGNLAIETEALLVTSDLLKSSCRLSDYLAPRIEELLEDTSPLDHSDHAYLLAAKSNLVEHTNPIYSEQLEEESYNYAKISGDLKLQVKIGCIMLNNDVHTIDKSELRELHRQCSLHNFPFYSSLLDFSIRGLGDEVALATKLAMMESLTTEGERIGVPQLSLMASMVSILSSFGDAIGSDDPMSNITKLLDDPNLSSMIRKCVDNTCFSQVDASMQLFVMCLIYPGYTNDTIRYLFTANRETMEADTQLYIEIFSSIERTSSLEETQHLCRELDSDSENIAKTKKSVRDWLFVARLKGVNIPNTTPSPTETPHHPTSTVAVDYNELVLTMNGTLENKNWTAALHASDAILVHRNQLEFDSENKWLLTLALQNKGLAHFNLGNFQVSIPLFEEVLQRKRAEGDVDVEDIVSLISIAKNNVTATYSSSESHSPQISGDLKRIQDWNEHCDAVGKHFSMRLRSLTAKSFWAGLICGGLIFLLILIDPGGDEPFWFVPLVVTTCTLIGFGFLIVLTNNKRQYKDGFVDGKPVLFCSWCGEWVKNGMFSNGPEKMKNHWQNSGHRGEIMLIAKRLQE